MTILHDWAIAHAIPWHALQDLKARLGVLPYVPTEAPTGKSESAVSNGVRLAISRRGDCAWRNNVGALVDERGVPVRYGLCNDSKALNRVCKSGDLIGIERVTVTPAMVGTQVGVFSSWEVKEHGWQYRGNAHEVAQLAWINLVIAHGGRARFICDAGQV
jgi:hypothetical protein